MKVFPTTVILFIGLSLFVLKRNARLRLRHNVNIAATGATRDRAERETEKHFDADAIDTLESEGGFVTSR